MLARPRLPDKTHISQWLLATLSLLIGLLENPFFLKCLILLVLQFPIQFQQSFLHLHYLIDPLTIYIDLNRGKGYFVLK